MAGSSLEERPTDGFFNLEVVHDAFVKSLSVDGDVDMDNYLVAYRELYKFFQLMGSVFGFVGSDVKSKIEILEEFRKGKDQAHYVTFRTMITYERDADLLRKSDFTSGSRTLLRLHRGLDFIRLFLERVGELKCDDKTTTVCQEAYNETLAKYHPWIIRKGAIVAMYSLPNRNGLLQKVCGSPAEIEKATQTLPRMLEATKEAYLRTDSIYTEFNLHDLP
ncbi:ceramide-1-phosphate transfer protein [Anabrus simplex]|uniref:ceramide-1-phosphate transfer protein n=1 Tax=Anabrus simplex TaxID=316456 RepID=UPI0034DD8588